METKQEPITDVGVLVGRFQVHELHDAHKDLIQSVCDRHDKVLIFLGLSPVRVTRNNPLDFESRKQMLLEAFPQVNVLYIKDIKSDDAWSKQLDTMISDLVGPTTTVTLYGSRDCFITYYSGQYSTIELMQESYVSGTEIRNSISRAVKNTPEFRAGAIWAAYNQFPKVHPTVDIAILNEKGDELLMARKPYETLYRFVGGFAEPRSENYEADARREVMEEANIDISDPEYVGSFYIKDWRYNQEVDKIKTLFFKCKYVSGRPEGGDDVCEVRWFKINDLKPEDIVEGHVQLLEALKANVCSD